MKQRIAAVALCLAAAPVFADGTEHDERAEAAESTGHAEHAEHERDNYIGISASRLTKGGAATGAGIAIGHRYSEYFAAEIAYEDTGALNVGNERTTAYSAAGVGYLPLTERLEAYGRVGLSTANTKDVTGVKANHGGTTYGAGFEAKVTDLYSVSLGWERIPVGDNVVIPRGNEDSYTLGLIRKF